MCAVTFCVWLAGIEAMFGGSNSTFQLVGGVADITTLVTGALPVFETVTWRSVVEPALALVESTWSGVDTVIVYVPVMVAWSAIAAFLPPPDTPAWIG